MENLFEKNIVRSPATHKVVGVRFFRLVTRFPWWKNDRVPTLVRAEEVFLENLPPICRFITTNN